MKFSLVIYFKYTQPVTWIHFNFLKRLVRFTQPNQFKGVKERSEMKFAAFFTLTVDWQFVELF